MSMSIIREIAELMEDREAQIAVAGEWKRVDWEWRREWRHRAEVVLGEIRRLGLGW